MREHLNWYESEMQPGDHLHIHIALITYLSCQYPFNLQLPFRMINCRSLCKPSISSIKFTHLKHPQPTTTIANILATTLGQELSRNPNTFLLGESEFPPHSNTSSITNHLRDKFGERRVWEAPVTPVANVGLCVGASLMGLKPVTHFTTFSNGLQAIDHIVNSCAKLRYMSTGILTSSIIFRGVNGPVEGYSGENSQCLASWYGSVPGLVTVAPYDAEDYQGLLRTAVRGKDPVVFLQGFGSYGQEFEISKEMLNEDFCVPFGKAKVMRRGRHVTLVTFSSNVGTALQASIALAEEGIEVEVINLRSIKPFDHETISQSVKKTSRIVTLQNGYPMFGIGAEISASVFENCFNYLDAPLVRITASDIPLPSSPKLQQLTLPQVSDVVRAVQKLLEGVTLR